ncbi:hypothetical protein RI129_005303 [Pyrocoelia pectoralis]|uniref:Uncharacterized protein n=1 Tax=Pyrocoelia pectoralis TaxID=417401 RepID=A0AAN7VI08_9COLE
MVVPIPMDSKSRQQTHKSKQYVGNALKINLQENNSRITVIGNECRINIDINKGKLTVIGNSCRIHVSGGDGEIIYNGNDGRIKLGSSVEEDRVQYFGNCGKIVKNGEVVCKQTENNSKSERGADEDTVRKNYVNVVNQKHKHFSCGLSTYSLGIPGVVMTTQISKCVRKSKH